MGDYGRSIEENPEIDHPWLAGVEAFIRRSLPLVQTVIGPTAMHAMYDDAPDQRATLRYRTDEPTYPEVVVKVNRYRLLSGSAAAHRVVSRCSPTRVPKVVAAEDNESGSLILMATFAGSALDAAAGPEPLIELAKTLARIQIDCVDESAYELGLATIQPDDIPRLFQNCLANIEEHFPAWQSDEGKIEVAIGFPAVDVLNRLTPLRQTVERWVDDLQKAGIPLSIEHGDCHGGNATRLSDGTVLIFDWENACRSHPFFSMEKVMTTGWAFDTGSSDGPWGYVRATPTQDELKRAYLGEFGLVTPVWERAFDAAMGLAVIKEIHHETEWARRCGWQDLNPEWTAQLVKRLFEHAHRYEQ